MGFVLVSPVAQYSILRMMLVFMRIRRQQHALALVHIVFREEEDRREFSWKSTRKDHMYQRIVRHR